MVRILLFCALPLAPPPPPPPPPHHHSWQWSVFKGHPYSQSICQNSSLTPALYGITAKIKLTPPQNTVVRIHYWTHTTPQSDGQNSLTCMSWCHKIMVWFHRWPNHRKWSGYIGKPKNTEQILKLFHTQCSEVIEFTNLTTCSVSWPNDILKNRFLGEGRAGKLQFIIELGICIW